MTSALDTQVGGSHYKHYVIQPIEFFHKNKIPYPEAAIIKYVLRYKDKNGLEDLNKAKHIIDLMIEMDGLDTKPKPGTLIYVDPRES